MQFRKYFPQDLPTAWTLVLHTIPLHVYARRYKLEFGLSGQKYKRFIDLSHDSSIPGASGVEALMIEVDAL